MNNYEWSTKLWCAKNFGWTPEQVEQMSDYEIQCLIKAHNNHIAQDNAERRRQERLSKIGK